MENMEKALTTDTCDSCGQKGLSVIHHHLGNPVLAQCKSCDPRNFEATARRDIDRWLAGQ